MGGRRALPQEGPGDPSGPEGLEDRATASPGCTPGRACIPGPPGPPALPAPSPGLHSPLGAFPGSPRSPCTLAGSPQTPLVALSSPCAPPRCSPVLLAPSPGLPASQPTLGPPALPAPSTDPPSGALPGSLSPPYSLLWSSHWSPTLTLSPADGRRTGRQKGPGRIPCQGGEEALPLPRQGPGSGPGTRPGPQGFPLQGQEAASVPGQETRQPVTVPFPVQVNREVRGVTGAPQLL